MFLHTPHRAAAASRCTQLMTLVAALTLLPLSAAHADAEVTVSRFHVDGMHCKGCEVGVRRVVGRLDGVREVEASHEEKLAVVTYEPESVGPEAIIEAIGKLGYTAKLEEPGEGAEPGGAAEPEGTDEPESTAELEPRAPAEAGR